MVRDVTGNDERQRTNSEGIFAGYPRTLPRLGRAILEEGNGGEAYALELFDMRGPGNRVCFGAGSRNCLVVTRQGSLKTARESESTERKRAFSVGEVVQHLSNAPFVCAVPVQRAAFRNG